MSNRKSSYRFVIVSTLIIAISAMTASASWTDYVNPFTYFASAETAQAEPAVQVETPPALVTTVTTNGGSGLAPTYPDLASAITALNAIPGGITSSPTTITVTGTETAPAGGYTITATGTVANPIVIDGQTTTTITAFTLRLAASCTTRYSR
ncbi:MAG: hypothetical protein IPG67_06165 [Acidobacteria bacterium]|nr:hypothetical protein [Acidobacteriota bacterium]